MEGFIEGLRIAEVILVKEKGDGCYGKVASRFTRAT